MQVDNRTNMLNRSLELLKGLSLELRMSHSLHSPMCLPQSHCDPHQGPCVSSEVERPMIPQPSRKMESILASEEMAKSIAKSPGNQEHRGI